MLGTGRVGMERERRKKGEREVETGAGPATVSPGFPLTSLLQRISKTGNVIKQRGVFIYLMVWKPKRMLAASGEGLTVLFQHSR